MDKMGVQYIKATAREENQRIDNFLFRILKSLPKTHVYRILRKGEVRVNKKRVGPDYRLVVEDEIRLPPIMLEKQEMAPQVLNTQQKIWLKDLILEETPDFIVVNKPAGWSVHAGSDTRVGLVEALRIARPDLKQVELIHRIDKETSGCLLLAKKPSVLKVFHQLFRARQLQKTYHLVVKGAWPKALNCVELPIEDKASRTSFQILRKHPDTTYLSAILHTGRQHQIRLHTEASGHPIVGDSKYGDFAFNRQIAAGTGVKRMLLHAYHVAFEYQGVAFAFTAPLPDYFQSFV